MTKQIVFSFDLTGSMYTCLSQVRRYISGTCSELFEAIDNLEIGVIAHGDYCDGPQWLKRLDLTKDKTKIQNFIQTVPPLSGGDAEEAYEAVLYEARSFKWADSAEAKAFVLIADDVPHEVGYKYEDRPYSYKYNTVHMDWREQAKRLAQDGVKVYSIQCLGNKYATPFYDKLADIGQGYKLDLNQFQIITDLLKAICYKQANQLPQFEERLQRSGQSIDISLLQNLDVLSGRKARSAPKSAFAKYAVHPSRFQALPVDHNTPIKNFVEDNGLTFRKGRGFYEFTKSVLVQSYKEVILQDRTTGEMFSGDKAREIAGIPIGKNANVRPTSLANYRCFIQSTSNNRKLLGGTTFLYERDDYRE
jgi:hypothetical protein